MRGKKGERHPDPDDPPRRRANKRRGHGSYENDRPPIVGSVGRESGQVRLRVEKHTDKRTLLSHVHRYTPSEATLYTDEWRAYEHRSKGNIKRFGMVSKSGREMRMGMGSRRFT